jgi:hypothetical protein
MELQIFKVGKGLDFGNRYLAFPYVFSPVSFLSEWNFMCIFSFIVSRLKNIPQKTPKKQHVFVVTKLDLRLGVFVDAAVDIIAEKFQSVLQFCCHILQLITYP